MPRDRSSTDSVPPLKPAVFYILLALAAGDSYGYAVMQTVREASQGRVPLRTGSFYRHLARLIDEGLVAESSPRRTGDDPRRGAYYRLTVSGQRALNEERQRLVSLLDAIDQIRPVGQKRHA
jgi:PadR family transcriptional regulator, regulatory protein PadR